MVWYRLAIASFFFGSAFAAPTPSLRFEPNVGQADPLARFVARGNGYSVLLDGNGMVMGLHGAKDAVLRMNLQQGQPGQAAAEQPLPSITNYYLGDDPAKWHPAVPNYAQVRFKSVYPGIDIVYYGKEGKLEYDFIVQPGADPDRIKLSFKGADSMRLNPAGDLVLALNGAEIIQKKPVIYQETNGRKVEVAGRYNLFPQTGEVHLALARYDHRRPLIIDPAIVYSSYLGGNGADNGNAVAVDSSRNAYFAGRSTGLFPTFGASIPQLIFGGGAADAFVTKFDSTGARTWATYLGGSGADAANAIAVDLIGSVFVAGVTSGSFPTAGAVTQTVYGGGASDAFAVRLGSGAGNLLYSTYIGGPGNDAANAIAAEGGATAAFVGGVAGTGFPLSNASQSAFGGGTSDGFVTKLDVNGARAFSTYLGGQADDAVRGLAIDASSNIYLTGDTASTLFPVLNAYQPVAGGGATSAFVTKMTSAGVLSYSTFLGGNTVAVGYGIAVDSSGNAYIAGQTAGNFNIFAAAQTPYGGGTSDGFVTKMNAAGTLVYSTYLGGSGADSASAVAVDSTGAAYVTGNTTSTNFPVAFPSAPAFQSSPGGAIDAFVTRFNPDGTGSYSSYLGGAANDSGTGIAVDSLGAAYITGNTNGGFPAVAAFQAAYGGSTDAFLTKVSLGIPLSTANLVALSVDTALRGGAAFTLFLGGTAFNPGATVTWNGTPLAVVGSITSTQAGVTVPTSLLSNAGLYAISITNPGETPSKSLLLNVVASAVTPVLAGAFPTFGTTVGGPASLIAWGTKLQPGAILQWNGVDLPTTQNIGLINGFCCASGLNVSQLPAALIKVPGPATITVYNPGGPPSAGIILTVPPIRTVTSITPSTTLANSAVTATVNGTGFVSGDTVQINGSNSGSTIFLNSTTLQRNVLASEISGLGTYNVYVSTLSVGAGASTQAFYASNVVPLTTSSISPGCSATATLSAYSADFPASGGTGSVGVTAPGNCPWNISGGAAWIGLPVGGVNGSGSGTLSPIGIQANTSSAARSATLTIASRTFSINQAGQGCIFTLSTSSPNATSQSSASYASAAISDSFSASPTGTDCSWSPVSSASWLVVSSATLVGTKTVFYSAAANPGSFSRTATITAGDKQFTVTQAGAAVTCTYSIPQSFQAFPSSGGILDVPVSAPGSCPTTANEPSGAAWFSIYEGTSGVGNTNVGFGVISNTSTSPRSVTVKLSGLDFVVFQAGANSPVCSLSALPLIVAAEGRAERVSDFVLQCANISTPTTVDLVLKLNTAIGNRLTSGLTDAVLTVNGLASQNGEATGYNTIRWRNVVLPPGVAAIQVTGVRADANQLNFAQIQGTVSLVSPSPVSISPSPVVTLGLPSSGVVFQRGAATPPAGGVQTVIPIKFQEGYASAFRVLSGATPATRLRIVLNNLPAGVTAYASVYSQEGPGKARLYLADSSGVGGAPAVGTSIAGDVYQLLTPAANTVTATWVVQTADDVRFESLTCNILLLNASATNVSTVLANLLGAQAPASNLSGASATLPVPRYLDPGSAPKKVNLRLSSSFSAASLFAADGKTRQSSRIVRYDYTPGSNINFAYTLLNDASNNGSGEPASNVVIQSNLAPGLTLISGSCSTTAPGATCTELPNGTGVQLGFANLAPEANARVTFQAKVITNLVAGTVLTNFTSGASNENPVDLDATTISESIILNIGPPTLGAPAANALNVAVNSSLSWSPPFGNAAYYDIYISTTNPPPSPPTVPNRPGVDNVTNTYAPTLLPNTRYYWRIAAKGQLSNEGGTSSETRTFTTAPGAPTLTSPADNAVNQPINTSLNWTAPAGGASSYDVYIDTVPNPVFKAATVNALTFAPALNGNTKYYWKVVSTNGASSAVRSFTTLPGTPVNTSPANAAVNQPLNVSLNWAAPAGGAPGYDVYLDTLPNPVFKAATVNTNTYQATGLAANTKYYWKVVATNGGASAIWSFTTVGAAPVNVSPADNASNQPTTVNLNWSGIAGAYDVYLDTLANPANKVATVNANTYQATGLAANTKYYWKITGIGGTSLTTSFTTAPPAATLINPVPGITLPGTSATFTWTTATGVTAYWLDVGTAIGQGNLCASGQVTTVTYACANLPLNGAPVYVQLWSLTAAGWGTPLRYSYTAATNSVSSITAPVPGTQLPPNATFSWAAAAGAQNYWVDIGTTLGQGNLCASGILPPSTTSFTCNNLPSSATSVYVQLWTRLAGVWISPQQYLYTPPSGTASIFSPTPGTQLQAVQIFTWTPTGLADAYWLDVGTNPGQGNLCASGVLTAATSNFTCSGIPPTGAATIYVQLFTRVGGVWSSPRQYTYLPPANVVVPVAATLTSPAPLSVLPGPTVTFNWTAGAALDYYWLDVGTAAGIGNLSSGIVNATSKTVTGLPTNGSPLFVRLWSHLANGSGWITPPIDYVFTANGGDPRATLLVPGAGTLVGSTITFGWKPGSGADGYWLDVGPTVGSGAYSSGLQTSLARTVTGLPCNSQPIYARLWTRVAGVFQSPIDYAFATQASCLNPDNRARLTAPALGTQVSGTSATFTWNAAPGAGQYWLDVGNALGSGNISAGPTAALSQSINTLPNDGKPLYVRLWTNIGGTWQSPIDYVF